MTGRLPRRTPRPGPRPSPGFVRPEARDALWRWREALVGGAVGALGIFWGLTGLGLVVIAGAVLMVGGIALVAIGLQRGRFRGRSGGMGVVVATEGQISYYGPLAGGVLALEGLETVTLDPTSRPATWVLAAPGFDTLYIPVNAEGVEALFDAFASIPEFPMARMLNVLETPGVEPVVIWHRRTRALH